VRFEQRKEQFRVALAVDKYRLNKLTLIAERNIAAETDAIILEIRKEYISLMADVRQDVELRQLEFLTEFGTKLNGFRQRLGKKDLDPKEKECILQLSYDAFTRVCDRLGELTDDMLQSAAAAKQS
jgi:hypothetical protein